MTLEAGWLKRQLDRVADDVDKWPDWMKREAEFASSNSSDRESQIEPEPQANQNMTARGEGRA
jgi:hypothetical protein